MLKKIFGRREFGLILFVLILCIIIGSINKVFFSLNNFNNILNSVSILAFMGIGQMMVILSGGIDLSVSSILAFSGMTVGMLVKNFPWMPPIFLILIGMIVGFVLGLINGIIVGKGKVPPIITTLGTMAIYRGLSIVISRGSWIDAFEMTKGFKQIARGHILGLNNLIFIAGVLSVLFFYFLKYTKKGREIYAYGNNHEAADFVGINSERVNYLVFSISGTLSGLGGVLWVSRVACAECYTATGFEMLTIAVCVLGGVSIFGGIGNVQGVLLGTFLIGIILNGLNVLGISEFWEMAIEGFIIMAAVIIDTILLRRSEQELRKSRRIFHE
jgi:rhamnose transport system permease protein